MGSSFTTKFKCTDLVYFDEFNSINEAIKTEKRLKKWKRDWKERLIKEFNPAFSDLAHDWFSGEDLQNMRDEPELPRMRPTPVKYWKP